MDTFEAIQEVIVNRRSTKPAVFNGNIIDDEDIKQLLQLANWAPTHGFTEPWRFIVYSGDAVQDFCRRHAELYKQATPPEKFNAGKYQKQQQNGDKASHIVLVYMKRGDNPNITELEEICATSAAVQNILLGAEALGIATLWSTGGMILSPAIKPFINLGEEDVMIGLLYMGYTNEPKKPGRRMPVEAKVKWVNG